LFGDHVLVLESPVDVCFVTAGAILLYAGLVSDVKQLASRLRQAGMPADREKSVMKSLLPLAQILV
jgi:hypothetical protein